MRTRTSPPGAWRRFAARLLAGVAALALAASAPAAEAPKRVVRDPYYGATLFDFFQEKYFSSLSDLMVSEHFARIPHHAEDAEILRGGLYLSYGLHREAAQIFARLIDKGAPPAARDRAWYYLAKIRYQRGMAAQAEEALARVKDPLPGDLQEDRLLLQANLLMGHGDYAGAAKLLGPVAQDEDAGLYTRFNLGVALIKSGAAARGSEVLDEVGVENVPTDELRSLRDKANVALGIAALQAHDPERARVYLERVRMAGLMASRALLGFGWAADAAGEPRTALVYWNELLTRDPGDPAVMEARLAVPFALTELGTVGPALDQYGRAISSFEKEDAALDESMAAVRSGRLLDGLVAANPGDEMGWFWSAARLPDMPHPIHVAQVLATNEFQEALKGYRDLQFLARTLRDWDEKLDVLDDMLANRRAAFAQRLPLISVQDQEKRIAALQARRDVAGTELTLAGQLGDGVAFADARERALGVRLERVRRILERTAGDPDPDLRAARERYRHVAGAYTWALSQQFAAREWEARKGLRAVAAALEESVRLRDALARAQREEPGHFDALAVRITALRQRVRAQIPRVNELIGLQRQAAQDLAIAELGRQKDRLYEYTNQARFAVAQIYDKANAARDAASAARAKPAGAAAAPAPAPAVAAPAAPSAMPSAAPAEGPVPPPAAAPQPASDGKEPGNAPRP